MSKFLELLEREIEEGTRDDAKAKEIRVRLPGRSFLDRLRRSRACLKKTGTPVPLIFFIGANNLSRHLPAKLTAGRRFQALGMWSLYRRLL
jgi:hypothetical protein